MSYNEIMEISKVIGKIEDELRDIKSAKEQAEAVIGSNKVLSDSLQALFDSANNVTKTLEKSALQIIAETTNKLDMLNIQASDLDSYVQQCVSKISEQSSLEQSKIGDELANLVQNLIGTISASTNQSLEAVGNELAEYRVLLNEAMKQFADSNSDVIVKQEGQVAEIDKLVACIQERQCNLDSKIEDLRQIGDEFGNLVQNLIGTISTSTNQSLEAVGNGFAEYRVLLHETTKKFADSTSYAIIKQEGQIAEIGKLLACIQERQSDLNSKIEELRPMDIVRVFDEISEIRRIESENAMAVKKCRVIDLSAFGVCMALGWNCHTH
ncbi:hypothetical protein [Bacteroides sp.]|uniref:hypothetical protein n=1 Tax=Bacteroides sp. TaxID=29523 RepID=UPI00260740E7|nr:hypothetical protein [Bacteroides sp.]MDD3041155.1 hypothetical protein [Bacteroides sp.]